ncbi:hypothetical protein N9766_07520, partial [Flavobacteriaceae bacterium]|nr:hypothetical protein [Flavobacteriaceae bacterium]
RLIKKGAIAAVEVHSELLKESNTQEFNYDIIKSSIQVVDTFTTLSDVNMLNLTILVDQLNDHSYRYKIINLKYAYDVFLFSKKVKAKDAVNTISPLIQTLNSFLAACAEVFNTPNSLVYRHTKQTNAYLNLFNEQLTNYKKAKKRRTRINTYLYLKKALTILYKCLVYRKYRTWLFTTLINTLKRELKKYIIKIQSLLFIFIMLFTDLIYQSTILLQFL